MTIHEALQLVGESERHKTIRLFYPIICKDGFRMSVQASRGHHCTPKVTLDIPYLSEYKNYEVGACNMEESLLKKYVENDLDDYKIYDQVPVEVLNEILEKHGGIKI